MTALMKESSRITTKLIKRFSMALISSQQLIMIRHTLSQFTKLTTSKGSSTEVIYVSYQINFFSRYLFNLTFCYKNANNRNIVVWHLCLSDDISVYLNTYNIYICIRQAVYSIHSFLKVLLLKSYANCHLLKYLSHNRSSVLTGRSS